MTHSFEFNVNFCNVAFYENENAVIEHCTMILENLEYNVQATFTVIHDNYSK